MKTWQLLSLGSFSCLGCLVLIPKETGCAKLTLALTGLACLVNEWLDLKRKAKYPIENSVNDVSKRAQTLLDKVITGLDSWITQRLLPDEPINPI